VRGLSRDGAIAESKDGTSFFDSSLHGSVAPSRISDDLLQNGIDVEDLDEDENPEQRIVYWKEELEKWLDGIVVQLVIISLVLLDVAILIVFAMILQSGDSEASLNTSSAEADVAAAAVTIIILACFLLELSLRQVAKGLRFWMDRWCIFDFVVSSSCPHRTSHQHRMSPQATPTEKLGTLMELLADAPCTDWYWLHISTCMQSK
jgi:hypothetical protein